MINLSRRQCLTDLKLNIIIHQRMSVDTAFNYTLATVSSFFAQKDKLAALKRTRSFIYLPESRF